MKKSLQVWSLLFDNGWYEKSYKKAYQKSYEKSLVEVIKVGLVLQKSHVKSYEKSYGV